MKRLVLVFCILFILSCTPAPIATQESTLKVSTSEGMHFANVTIKGGELRLVVIKEVPEIETLKSVLENIKTKDLFLEYDTREGDKLVLKRDLIKSTDPRYIYVVTDELALNGFRVDMK